MDLWGNEDEDEYRARKRAEIFSSSYHFENYGMLDDFHKFDYLLIIKIVRSGTG